MIEAMMKIFAAVGVPMVLCLLLTNLFCPGDWLGVSNGWTL
jgi:hypothetical protein